MIKKTGHLTKIRDTQRKYQASGQPTNKTSIDHCSVVFRWGTQLHRHIFGDLIAFIFLCTARYWQHISRCLKQTFHPDSNLTIKYRILSAHHCDFNHKKI